MRPTADCPAHSASVPARDDEGIFIDGGRWSRRDRAGALSRRACCRPVINSVRGWTVNRSGCARARLRAAASATARTGTREARAPRQCAVGAQARRALRIGKKFPHFLENCTCKDFGNQYDYAELKFLAFGGFNEKDGSERRLVTAPKRTVTGCREVRCVVSVAKYWCTSAPACMSADDRPSVS